MPIEQWLGLFRTPVDTVGLILFVLVFPVYHGSYRYLMLLFPNQAAKTRMDLFRRSWIEGLLERRDYLLAAQQTRNLTMVNSLLASSALILMGVTANMLLNLSQVSAELSETRAWVLRPELVGAKLLLLITVFGVAFAYCMNSLRHLGHFNLVIGADPAVLDAEEGSSVDYFATLINRASNRYTLGVRCLYSASPLFLWLFDPWLFLGLTLFWGVKFIGFQDFAHVLNRRRR
jgi:uncharacterized membrane protein